MSTLLNLKCRPLFYNVYKVYIIFLTFVCLFFLFDYTFYKSGYSSTLKSVDGKNSLNIIKQAVLIYKTHNLNISLQCLHLSYVNYILKYSGIRIWNIYRINISITIKLKRYTYISTGEKNCSNVDPEF